MEILASVDLPGETFLPQVSVQASCVFLRRRHEVSLESGQSEVLTQYLSAMGRFHNYRFRKIMLIACQKPDATNVAGLRTWNSLGRFVKRGEKGILILARMIARKKAASSAEATEDAKQPQAQLYGFRAVYVFDRLSRDLRPTFARS